MLTSRQTSRHSKARMRAPQHLNAALRQARPAVALTVLDEQSWYKHVSLIGRIVEIHDDIGLADIDRLALRYTGSAYPERAHRRVSMWMAVDVWHGWDATGAIATHADWKP